MNDTRHHVVTQDEEAAVLQHVKREYPERTDTEILSHMRRYHLTAGSVAEMDTPEAAADRDALLESMRHE